MRYSPGHSVYVFHFGVIFPAPKDNQIMESRGAIVKLKLVKLGLLGTFYMFFVNFLFALLLFLADCAARLIALFLLHVLELHKSPPILVHSGSLLSQPATDSRGLASRTCPRISPLCARLRKDAPLLFFKVSSLLLILRLKYNPMSYKTC